MSCEICDTITEICSADFEEYDEEILGEVSDVLSYDCPHSESIPRASNFEEPLSNFPDRMLAIKKDSDQTGARFGLATLTQDGQILFDNISTTSMELVYRPEMPGHPGHGILPDPKWIDLRVVHSWIMQCKNQHKAQCHEPVWLKGVGVTELEWLIDVVDECIVHSPRRGTSYVALSYTWGLGRNLKNTKATLQALQVPGAFRLDHFANQLPTTIRNTIDLVQLLGERYLWVDALCIVQDDPISLGQNLNQMHLIYAHSTFCVVAGTGCGAEYGLRGLQNFSRARDLEMRVYDLAGGEKLVAKPLAQDPTNGTKCSYHQRGWTFQEWVFSRRRLVFNHGPLVWQCQCAKWQETQMMHPQADLRWKLKNKSRENKLDPAPSIWDFMPIASIFNTKAPTIEEDAPKAFAGIQAMLHRVHPGGLLYGISEMFFEISLAWSSLYSDVQRRKGVDPEKEADNGLPSWSWLGWQGPITFPYDAEFRLTEPWHHHEQKTGFREPVTQFSTMKYPNSADRRLIRSGWFEHKINAVVGDHGTGLPSRWTQQAYDPERHLYDFCPSLNKPMALFSHSSDPQQKFKYPVSVLNWSDPPVLSEQTQYLYCETYRASLVLASNIEAFQVPDYKRRVNFGGSDGQTILSLTLHTLKEAEELVDKSSRPKRIDLIAFARGWSTWLGRDIIQRPDENGGEILDSIKIPGTDARDCYFVLWVDIRDGVAYRLASGEARLDWWEASSANRPIPVVLG